MLDLLNSTNKAVVPGTVIRYSQAPINAKNKS